MKKTNFFKSFFIVSLAALSFTACGKKKNATTNSKTTTTKKTTKRQTTTKSTEPAPVVSPNKCYVSNDNTQMIFKKDIENDKLVNLILLEELGRVVDIKPIYENGNIKKVKLTVSGENDYINIYDLFEVKDSFKPISMIDSHDYYDKSYFNHVYSVVYLKFNDNSITIKYDNITFTFNIDGTVSNNLDEITSTNKSIKYKGYKANLSFSNDALSYDFYTDNTNKTKRTTILKKDYIEIAVPDYDSSGDKVALEFTNDGKIKQTYKYVGKDGTLKTGDEFIVELDENDMPKIASYTDGSDTSYSVISYENNTLTLSDYTDLTDTTTFTGKSVIQFDEYHRILSNDYYDGSDTTPTYLYSYEYNDSGLMIKSSSTNPYSGERSALFEYTDSGLLSKYSEKEGDAIKYYYMYEYNDNNDLSRVSEYRRNHDNTLFLGNDYEYTYESVNNYDCTTLISKSYNEDGTLASTFKFVYKVKGNDSILETSRLYSGQYVLTNKTTVTNTENSLYTECSDSYRTNGEYYRRYVINFDIKDNHRNVLDEGSTKNELKSREDVYGIDGEGKPYLTNYYLFNDGKQYFSCTYTYDSSYTNIVKTETYDYEHSSNGTIFKVKYVSETKDTANNCFTRRVIDYFKPDEAFAGDVKKDATYNFNLDDQTIERGAIIDEYIVNNDVKTRKHVDITNYNDGKIAEIMTTYYKEDDSTIDYKSKDNYYYFDNSSYELQCSVDYDLDFDYMITSKWLYENGTGVKIFRALVSRETEKIKYDVRLILDHNLDNCFLVYGYNQDGNQYINKVVMYVNDITNNKYQIYTLKDGLINDETNYYNLSNYDTDGILHDGNVTIDSAKLPD